MIATTYDIIRDLKRIASGSKYFGLEFGPMIRSYARLRSASDRAGTRSNTIPILNFNIRYLDSETLFSQFQDIFVGRIYEPSIDCTTPVIIDCGSNIGISILYFKTRYPQATIVAFEPNPDQFDVLKNNVVSNELNDVQLHQLAVSDEIGTLEFFINETSPGSLNMGLVKRGDEIPTINVSSTVLSQHLPDSVDLLKLDIEGAEESVLRDLEANGKLGNIGKIICEYHHHIQEGVDRLSVTLSMLERAGFSYQLFASSDYTPDFGSYQDIMIYASNNNWS